MKSTISFAFKRMALKANYRIFSTKLMLFILVSFLTAIWASASFAQDYSSILNKVEELETRLDNIEYQMTETFRANYNLPNLETRLNKLEKEISGVTQKKHAIPDLSGIEARLAKLESELTNTNQGQDIAAIESSIDELSFQVKLLEDNYTVGEIGGGMNMGNEYMAELSGPAPGMKSSITELPETPENAPEKASIKFDKTPKISGLLKSYWQYDMYEVAENQNNITLKYGRVSIKGGISEDVGYKFQMDFTRSGDDMLLDGFVNFNPTSWATMNVGQFKTPYSTINLRSASKQRFISKPMMASTTAPPTRDIGLSITTKSNQYTTTFGVFNGSGQNETDMNTAKNVAGRVTYKAAAKLNLSANVYYGKTPYAVADTLNLYEDLMMYNGGAEFKHKNLSLEGEYGYYETETLKRTGYFVDAVYNYPTQGILKTVSPALRYEWYDSDTNIRDNAKMRYTLGLKFVFAKLPNMHIRADYQYNEYESGTAEKNTFLTEMQLTF